MNVNALNLLSAGTGILFLILIIWNIFIELRLKKFFRGKRAKDLEEVLVDLSKDLEKLDISRKEIEKYLETVEKRLRKSIQTLNIIRFNPFENAGSNQSFSIAFLDENGDGVVISSLYSREKINVYAKPIKRYTSEYPLSEEEKEAIKGSLDTNHEL